MRVLLLCGLLLFLVLNVESSFFLNGRNRQQEQQQKKYNKKESLLESSLRNVGINKTNWVKDEIIYIEQSIASNCNCVNYSCSCCSHISLPRIKLNDTACVNLTYLSDELGFKFTFDIDGTIYYEKDISAKNPPPMCFGIPYLEDGAKLCLKFYNLDWRNSTYTGCVDLVAYLFDAKVAQLKIGCFRFGNNSGVIYSRSKQYIYISGTNNKNNRTIADILRENENFIEKIDIKPSTNELEESFSVFSRMDNLIKSLFRNSFYPSEYRNNYKDKKKNNKKNNNNNSNNNNDDWK